MVSFEEWLDKKYQELIKDERKKTIKKVLAVLENQNPKGRSTDKYGCQLCMEFSIEEIKKLGDV